MEPKGFPYDPVLLAFAIGALLGIWRGMQARAKEMTLTAKDKLARIRRQEEVNDTDASLP